MSAPEQTKEYDQCLDQLIGWGQLSPKERETLIALRRELRELRERLSKSK
jgi:hypothetical protein